jgi:transposase
MGVPGTRITQEEIGEIKTYKKLGWTVAQICEAVKRDARSVRRVLKGVVASRTRATCQKVIARRAIIKKLVVTKKVVDGVDVGRMYPSVRSIQAAYKRQRGAPEAHTSTIHRDIQALGFKSRVRPKVVNDDPIKNAQRLAFARSMYRLKCKNILFTDECWVTTNDNTNRSEFVSEDHPASLRVHMKRAQCKVMIWGAIGLGVKSDLHFVTESVTSKYYVDNILPLIKTNLKKIPRGVLMQDNARPHSANATSLALEKEKITALDWPPYSPHLNPIEHLWSTLHRRIAERAPETIEELKEAANECWASFTMKEVNKYVESFPKRLRRTVELRGKPW